MRQGSSVLTITTSFLFANSVSGQLRKLRFFSGVKNDMKTEAEDQWDTESTSSTSTSSSLSSPEKGQRQEPTLRLRGGCLKLPARQGSKRRLGDDEELPTLVWWAAGGRTHHKPLTGKQLREWKRKSDGYERGNKKRSWIGEFAFAMTSGRVGRESGNKKEKKKKGEDPENGGDEGDDGGGDGEGGS
ncbi:hypothetical protein FQN54_006988 [Arachnomyces sp. PD_36]|nr:hypothetical protein FQN54_006988 [Arachnomyces sp. PD_36]